MDPVKEMALSLAKRLNSSDIKEIKSHIGLLELTCDIVEEAIQRLKNSQLNFDSRYKKQLAIDLSTHILEILVTKNLINQSLESNIRQLLKLENINQISDLIDDIISIWNDAKYYTFRFCQCLRINKRSVRKLEHIKIQPVKKNTYNTNFTNV